MRDIGPLEIVLILIVLLLLFGAKKLPELARGTGRALRIFKSETKGLLTDDEDESAAATPSAPQAIQAAPPEPVQPPAATQQPQQPAQPGQGQTRQQPGA